MNKTTKTILSNNEMKELKGGVSSSAGDDVINKNKVATCRCTWKDNSVTINENKVTGCLCTCMLSNQILLN